MTVSRRVVFALAVLQVIVAGFFALVGSFADGGTMWERLLLVVLQPLAALGLLFLVTVSRPAIPVILVAVALLAATVVADGALAWNIARGATKGDWELPVVWALIPAVGLVYTLAMLKRPRATAK